MSTHNIYFHGEIREIFMWIFGLSETMIGKVPNTVSGLGISTIL